MIGAVIFVIGFLLLLMISFGVPTIPPGSMAHQMMGIPETTYPVMGIPANLFINGIVNGFFWGFMLWLFYSLAHLATKKEPTVKIELEEKAKEKEEAEEKAEEAITEEEGEGK